MQLSVFLHSGQLGWGRGGGGGGVGVVASLMQHLISLGPGHLFETKVPPSQPLFLTLRQNPEPVPAAHGIVTQH